MVKERVPAHEEVQHTAVADSMLEAIIEGDWDDAAEIRKKVEGTTDQNWGERLYKLGEDIHGFVEAFNRKFSDEQEKERIEDALKFMLQVHVDQQDRVDGTPTISHALFVARSVLEDYSYATSDDIIAALLHDVIEDRPTLLTKMVEEDISEEANEEYLRGKARELIEKRFGEEVSLLVFNLTSPLPYPHLTSGGAEKQTPKEKREGYFSHVMGIVLSRKNGLIAIKWADAKQNMPLAPLTAHARKLRKGGDEGGANRAEEKRDQLRQKYERPLKEIWLPFWRDTVSKENPLYSQREGALAFIQNLLQTDYADDSS